MTEEIEILKRREYLVVKGNELIQRNRFELSLTEQKTIAFICSMIKPVSAIDAASGAPYELVYEFNIKDYCKICGIDYNQGKNYADIKDTLKRLRDRSMWLTLPDGSETLVGWLSKVRTNKRSGKAIIELDRDLVPYLFNLGQRFTQYQLYNILGMKSAFSIRLYELMKSYAFQKSKTFDLDALKKLLMVDTVPSYKDFSLFRRKVLEIAQREINELTDISIYYEPIKSGRKVVKLKVRVEQKSPVEKMITSSAISARLDNND